MSRAIDLHKTSQRGLRPTNEDVEKFKLNLGQNANPNYAPIDLFIICDGHGGDSVANFVAPKIEKYLTNANLTYPLRHDQICKIWSYIQNEVIQHPQKIASFCGSTALVLIRYLDNASQENVQIINIGDCRAVLSRKGLAIPLSKDHKPYWPDEKSRINTINAKNPSNIKEIHYDAGDWRVGDLSVSRSFGDLDNTPHITHIPDSFNYKLKPTDEFIIMACDGLWDNVQSHEAVNFVRDHMNNKNTEFYKIEYQLDGKKMIYPSDEVKKTNNIARKMASYAIAKGSTDNVSILIIFFNPRKTI